MTAKDDTTHGVPFDATCLVGQTPQPVAPERRARLVVLAGWEVGSQHDVAVARCRIGRKPGLPLTIPNSSVSRNHADVTVVEAPDGTASFEVRDLGSSNGTFVNGLRVDAAPLRDGDKLRLGEVTFRFELQDAEDQAYQQHIYDLIHFDRATGLMTLESFRRRLDLEIARAAPGDRFCLAMTDLDGLKRVNDTYGHQAGAMVVREMGAMIREVLRPHDRAGLFGGDETIILYPNTRIADAAALAETLRARIESRTFEHEVHSFQVTISQGLAEWPAHGRAAGEVIAAADRALYAAKAAGRNCTRAAEG